MDQTDMNTASGASNSADFQPVTQNPQGNVGGGLQPGGSSPQPSTTASGSNVFDQPGINPQAFPQTGSLQVVDTTSPGLSAAVVSEVSPAPHLALFLILIFGAAIAVWVLWKLTPRPVTVPETMAAAPAPAAAKPVKPKPNKRPRAKKKK